MRIPTYILTEKFSLGENKELPEGAFVKPLELCYVPKHILERPEHKHFNAEKEVYVYCHYGITAVPRKIIKELA